MRRALVVGILCMVGVAGIAILAFGAANAVTLNLTLPGEVQALDPNLAGDANSSIVCEQLWLGMFSLNVKTYAFEPRLATTWSVSDDGLVWTFHIRDDIPWVSYDPASDTVKKQRNVNAHDFEHSMKRVADPKTGANIVFLLYHVVKNLYEVNTGAAGYSIDDVGVKALDETTVQFTLERPCAFFSYLLCLRPSRPIPPEPVAAHGDRWATPEFAWTNGPYVLAAHVPNASYSFKKNPYYPGAENIQIERVEVVIVDAPAALALYESNQIDAMIGLPADQIERVKKDPVLSKDLKVVPNLGVEEVQWVNTEPPFDDVRVRQAFSAAIDRQLIVDTVSKGGEQPATTFAPWPGVFGSVDPAEHIGQGYDPMLARAKLQAYLDEKGMTIDDFNKTYNLTYGSDCSDFRQRMQQALAAMWYKELGVKVTMTCQQLTVYTQSTKKAVPVEQAFNIFRKGILPYYPDQSVFIAQYKCDNENECRRGCADANCKTCNDTEFDRVIAAANATLDPVERAALYRRAEQIAFDEEFIFAPLYWRTNLFMTKPWVVERDFSVFSNPRWNDWKLDWQAKQAARR